MTEEKIIEVLGSLQGEPETPHHKSALRRSLVHVASSKGFAAPVFSLRYVSMKTIVFPAGALVAVALLAVFVFNPIDPQVAQAQEQVARSWARAVQISPEMRAQIEEQMIADMLKTLEEAKAAPDLRIMTKEEYEKEAQFTFSHSPATTAVMSGQVTAGAAKTVSFMRVNTDGAMPAEGGVSIKGNAVFSTKIDQGDVVKMGTFSAGMMVNGVEGEGFSEPVKYLSYTDPKGHKTVLGLDKNDTPVFKFSTLNPEDVKQFEDGSIGIEGNVVKVINAGAAESIEQ